jgi:hypothetical protein
LCRLGLLKGYISWLSALGLSIMALLSSSESGDSVSDRTPRWRGTLEVISEVEGSVT